MLKELIGRQINQEVGINIHGAHRIDTAEILSAADEYFSVKMEQDNNVYHVPYTNIVKVIENPSGVVVSGFFKSHHSHPMVIKIGHVVEYVPT
ncbi:hypothetical protein [Rhodopirellula sp. MGV]|uniref:hypothetical protein n=1 Tax=Rhodopirellula sp. MGV TaxID=2023130 RepID=UPI000B95CB8A|nr:hypothetical protein [Rhodopirellula sp. MGV]OYP36733.1 hypothetical protein CGZ80_07475 [Rhodopirellula sp. MGV]PNY34426.1 hypothetical protein C2E31_23545 [Rhodopirellula baltica]